MESAAQVKRILDTLRLVSLPSKMLTVFQQLLLRILLDSVRELYGCHAFSSLQSAAHRSWCKKQKVKVVGGAAPAWKQKKKERGGPENKIRLGGYVVAGEKMAVDDFFVTHPQPTTHTSHHAHTHTAHTRVDRGIWTCEPWEGAVKRWRSSIFGGYHISHGLWKERGSAGFMSRHHGAPESLDYAISSSTQPRDDGIG